MTSKVDHWVSSPYCFCKDLPWLVLSGVRASSLLSGGWGWEDWAILAATLIALALFLFLLFLLLCLLCPGGLCCGKGAACCGKKEKKEKLGLASAQGVEMASYGGSQDSNLTAVDLKLPRAWMDTSKGDADERGDLGLGAGAFGQHKNWGASGAGGDASGALVRRLGYDHDRSDNSGNLRDRSEYSGNLRDRSEYSGNLRDRSEYSGNLRDRSEYSGNLRDRLEHSGLVRSGVDEDQHDGSARLDYYRNQSAATIMTPNGGGKGRDEVHEWERSSTTETRRVVESRQTRHDDVISELADVLSERFGSRKDLDASHASSRDHASHSQSAESGHAEMTSSNMALVKSSGAATSGSATSAGDGSPIFQCYTVTKKTTTTTYGDEEGDEETAVVTTTERKWREGLNEVGEITVDAAATVGELLPSIGAPAHVVNDVSNVRTVKSLTTVEGGASDVVRRYEYQQTSKDTDTLM